MAAFVGVFAVVVVILAVGCMIAERAMGTHSVVPGDQPQPKSPRAEV